MIPVVRCLPSAQQVAHVAAAACVFCGICDLLYAQLCREQAEDAANVSHERPRHVPAERQITRLDQKADLVKGTPTRHLDYIMLTRP